MTKKNNHVEFDTEQLMAALRSGFNPNDAESNDIEKLLLDYQEDIEEEADSEEASVSISALGGEYKIGPFDVKCAIGNLALLSEINSPLVSGTLKQGDQITFEDCVEAIYVLVKGKEACEPIMAIKQRISDLMLLKPMVKDNPILADKIIAKAEQISKARVNFTKAAIDFWEEEFLGYNFQDVINDIITSISDIMKMTETFPETKAQTTQKKS